MDLWTLIISVYGPYVFGLVTFLSIWFAAIKPELDSRQLQFDALQEIMTNQHKIVADVEDVSTSMQVTATILERTVERLNGNEN